MHLVFEVKIELQSSTQGQKQHIYSFGYFLREFIMEITENLTGEVNSVTPDI